MVKQETKRKRRLFSRKGIIGDDSRIVRIVTAVVLLVSCASLTFTQLGFAGLGFEGRYAAYAVALLIPIALAALLLGRLWGTLVGLFAGAVLLGHAQYMPLDYYELTFVTPLTSVLILGVCGFLLGFLFAFALRNDPPPIKSAVYIVIVCVVVSVLYSAGFVVNTMISMFVDTSSQVMRNMVDADTNFTNDEVGMAFMVNAVKAATRLGDLGQQVLANAFLMSLFCVCGGVVVRKVRRSVGNVGLRGVFAAWLVVVVAIAFMITAGASFASVTQGEAKEAAADMKDEANYLCIQMSHSLARVDLLDEALMKGEFDSDKLDPNDMGKFFNSLSAESLLAGYEKEKDGTILLLAPDEVEDASTALGPKINRTILLSDDGDFPVGSNLSEIVSDEVSQAIGRSVESGEACRAIYDRINSKSFDSSFEETGSLASEIVYLYAQKVDGYTVFVMKPASMVFANRREIMLWTTVSAFVLLAAVFVMVFQLLNRVVVRRIDGTNDVLGHITEGNLEARVNERETREFSSLSDGINATVDALKGWISEAETRMDAELATAREIQLSALPRTFPPYPDIPRFDVYASMNPAREVGGDFYDFFLIGNDCDADAGKLGFVVADVSGKGVPAALFMMKAMTQIRDYLQSGMAVGEAVENANRQLVDGNDAGMFVTAWVGVLDYGSARIDFVNAGHNPPLLWNGGAWRWLTEKSGMPLGLFDGFPYEAFSFECTIGDELLLYTDGVTEAMNVEGELYGEARLEALANDKFDLHPRALVEEVRFDVAEHAAGAEQSDDITILALEYGVPPEITATLVVPADVGMLNHVNAFIHTELDRRLCPLRVQNQIDIAVEELFVNVAHYAYPEATPERPGMVRIGYTYSAEPPSVEIVISDDGIPYDPLAKPDAVTPDDIMEVPIGGLGILMAKRSVDEMTYERLDDSNIVTILKKW